MEYLFVNNIEIYKYKAKDSEKKRSFVIVDNKKKLDNTNMSMIFRSIMIVLMLLIFWIFINIK